ncbi:MAG: M23 family metallopeptidase [Lachnospiraceae bacterium]|nr:M23 family metallopeptidase [Lachnospiraceae bacterium]
MNICSNPGKTICIKKHVWYAEMERIMRKNNTSLRKEKLILLSAAAFVLTALTMTGVYMREKGNVSDENRLQVKEIGTEEISEKMEEIVHNDEDYRNAQDMDADPDTWEVDTYNVEALLEDVDKSKKEVVLAPSEDAVSEEAATENTAETAAGGVAEGHLVFPMEQKMVWPMVGDIVMNYSMDKTILFETLGQYRYNPAVMISGVAGDVVKAPANCVIKEISSNLELGKYMVLNLGGGYELTLGQLDGMNFKVGDAVEEGVVLATLGNPSIYYSAEGANLYMKLEKDKVPVNPMDVLD